MAIREQHIAALQNDWDTNPRWVGVSRRHSAADVVRLRGSLSIEHTLAQRGAERLWRSLHDEPFIGALGALTADQAVLQVQAGLKAVYVSGEMYPPAPLAVRRINDSLQRADQLQWAEGEGELDYYAPVVADAEAGFVGVMNAYELMKAMIDAGAAGVHFDDQLASARHGGAKVLVPTRAAIDKLSAARLAADVMGTPTLLIARTDAEAASLLSSDVDELDQPFCSGERTAEGHYRVRSGLEQAIARALAYAPYADLVWCETRKPDLAFAQAFAEAVHARFPGKLLAYHCSPAFNWKKNLDDATIARFQKELGAMGYKFQFVSLAGAQALNHGMYKLAHGYARRQMAAYVELQEEEFAAVRKGYAALSMAA
ncbi:isocitrate lyase [Duganella sp. FT80W]|uniref:Isocitrate lyase n=1 Tax=Duganella guangzhouensis TaxID=2666084 RepID=A0A6I2L4V5_9BURK|nr:isocitrate lyase/phosphoenolpyruvate mutase family protein [Duganella guangzhouensis]MRW93221.1 isocitrate lyase [Duganella guangzhouensis]